MTRALIIALALILISSSAWADYLIVVDPTRLSAAVSTRGEGPDGQVIRPRAVSAACIRDGIFGPAAFLPRLDRCRALAAVPGLREALDGLLVTGTESDTTVFDLVAAGGTVAVEPRRRLACQPGSCGRELFEDASYPPELVDRPNPPPPTLPVIADFSVAPEQLTPGESALLSWSADEVNRCRIINSTSGEQLNVESSGQRVVTAMTDTIWTLICSDSGGTSTAQALVRVIPPEQSPVITVFRSRRADVPIGEQTTLIWQTQRAKTCVLSSGDGPLAVPTRARLPKSVNEDIVFRLACENDHGSVSSTVRVLATSASQAPLIERFDIDRNVVSRGDSLFATWQASDATRCRLRSSQQMVNWPLGIAGQFKLVPSMNTNYTLVCRNAFGSDQKTVMVTVNDSQEPVRIDLFAIDSPDNLRNLRGSHDALKLTRPDPVRLSWSSSGALACRLDTDDGRSFLVPTSGDRIISFEQSTAIQINCISNTGEAQAFQQVQLINDFIYTDRFQSD